jgi:hypothetical protein
MPSKLWYGEQAFWVSNATKDLLYEAAVEVAKHGDAETRRRLADDAPLVGCYNVSGVGFDLEAFVQAFGGKDAWRRATEEHFDAVEALCANDRCVELMRKLFRWVWFVLDGGPCSTATGEHPDFDDMPDQPDTDGRSQPA